MLERMSNNAPASVANLDTLVKKVNSITDLRLDENNANRGTDRGRHLLAESLSKLGAGCSIVCDRNGTVIGGNKTLESAQKLGLEIEVVHTQGDKLVAVIRDDLDLKSDPRARELALADNRISELNLDWDVEQILQDIDQLNLDGLWNEKELERLQNSLDLTAFEASASSTDDDETDNEFGNSEDKHLSNKPESDMFSFHCLLSQQQRERLFQAINYAKNKHGLETTTEVLDAIAKEHLK